MSPPGPPRGNTRALPPPLEHCPRDAVLCPDGLPSRIVAPSWPAQPGRLARAGVQPTLPRYAMPCWAARYGRSGLTLRRCSMPPRLLAQRALIAVVTLAAVATSLTGLLGAQSLVPPPTTVQNQPYGVVANSTTNKIYVSNT